MHTRSRLVASSLLALTLAAPSAFAASANPAAAAKLLHYVKSHNLPCLECHTVNHQAVGPAWFKVAERYHNTPGAAAMLAKRIAKGNVGVWGYIPMPGGLATPAQAKKLAKMVLDLDSK